MWESGFLMIHWTEREKWFFGLIVFLLFLMFSLIVYLNLEEKTVVDDSIPTLDLSIHDLDRPLAMNKVSSNPTESDRNKEQATPTETILIDVKGEVESPGVYPLPKGARVDDAIKAAGGATSQADLTAINLAEKLSDGLAVLIPSIEDKKDKELNSSIVSAANGSSGKSSSSSHSKVSLNQASKDELMQLPGIGESKADAIIRYRDQFGPFETVEQLLEVKGIGDKMLENIREYITLD
jgi:competence protein ComEA